MNKILDEEGFSQVIYELAKSKKPIVGHNPMYDLMFTYQQFIDDLPPTYDQFTHKIGKYFETVYDTKVFCLAAGRYGRTTLNDVYEKVIKEKLTHECANVQLDHEHVAFS
jgi:poly(A)-specific ribonuclease